MKFKLDSKTKNIFVDQLIEMGYSYQEAKKALSTCSDDLEAAEVVEQLSGDVDYEA